MRKSALSLICLSCCLTAAEPTMAAPTAAVAVVVPTQGNTIGGTVRFTQIGDGRVHVVADLKGLTPGKHGFHIHEFGDISSADGSAAGGHFNPGGHQHGGPQSPAHHAGDLGNIEAGADGIAHLDVELDGINILGSNAILGRAVVVHANADDLAGQPAGNAGPRIGVGAIGLSK